MCFLSLHFSGTVMFHFVIFTLLWTHHHMGNIIKPTLVTLILIKPYLSISRISNTISPPMTLATVGNRKSQFSNSVTPLILHGSLTQQMSGESKSLQSSRLWGFNWPQQLVFPHLPLRWPTADAPWHCLCCVFFLSQSPKPRELHAFPTCIWLGNFVEHVNISEKCCQSDGC